LKSPSLWAGAFQYVLISSRNSEQRGVGKELDLGSSYEAVFKKKIRNSKIVVKYYQIGGLTMSILETTDLKEQGTVSETTNKKKRQRMGPLRIAIFVFFLMVFLVSAGMLAKNYFEDQKAQSDFTELVVSGGYDLKALLEQNQDIIGWLQIKDTKINYPVMQTKNDPEFYLRRDFKKGKSVAGTPFLDAASDINEPTLNWVIYGHNIKSGIMFHDLLKYADKDFYEKHKTFTFDTINGTGTYEIVAVYYTQIYTTAYDGFKYYHYNDITSPELLKEFIAGSKSLSLYETGVTVENEQVLTLSTCAYQVEDGRFVVVAKKIG
jgi:sortase B